MEYIRCNYGHVYSSDEKECPICAAGAETTSSLGVGGGNYSSKTEPMFFGAGKTEPIGVGSMNMTSPPGAFSMPSAPTAPPTEAFGGMNTQNRMNDIGHTVPQSSPVEEYGATRPVFASKEENFVPLVGWLVAIEGPAKGKDYKIYPGYNYIGRGAQMSIQIEGDSTISSNKAAVIGFEPTQKMFLFGPGEGCNFVYVNGEPIMSQAVVHDRDVLTVGQTKLILVVLCNDSFDWN